ncbi:MAG TPA: ABC transporter transmembrane domain-containing protein, partial [Candidatus Acidoferrum sp.]|nr:ABC transporter transmembrane domain-containing protein [Candidatus Acidoferrum sp.]
MEAAIEKITAVPQPPAVYDRPVERDDPLLLCLVIMSRIYGVPKSTTALSAGLPIPPSGITPELFVHAADRIGLSASMARRKFNAISALQLPCVLMLKDGQACVFLRRVDGKLAEIATPENLDGTNHVSLRDLADRFTGTLICVRPKIRMDVRSTDLAAPPPRSWFWGSVFSFTPIYIEVIIAALLLNTFAIASPIFTMIVYDRVVPNQAFDTLTVLALGVGMAFTFDFILRTLRGYFLDRTGKELDKKISARIFEQILHVKMAAGPTSAGAFANNIREFETLRDFFTSASLSALVDLPFLLFFLAVIYWIAGPVVAVPAIIIPTVLLVSAFVQIPMRRAVERSYREGAQKHAALVETISGLDSIKAASAEGRRQRDWNGYVGASAVSAMASKFWSSISVNFTLLASNIATVAAVCWGVYRTADGEMTTGAMVAVSMLTSRAMAPLAQISGLIVRFHQSWTSLKGLNRLMNLPTERPVG